MIEQDLPENHQKDDVHRIKQIKKVFRGFSLDFGAVGKASAPGQMNASDLREILTLIDKSI